MTELEQLRSEIDRVDKELATLFCRRMDLVARIAERKEADGLSVKDQARERALAALDEAAIQNADYLSYYRQVRKALLDASRSYQAARRMKIGIKRQNAAYEVIIERGGLARAKERFGFSGRALIVTGEGIPQAYIKTLLQDCPEAEVVTLREGEENKTLDALAKILTAAQNAGLTRQDCILSLGGGLIGDLAGLAASLYLRGVAYYAIPTTLLAMVDAGVGGKTGVNFGGYKNQVGSFYQPSGVMIDPALLATLPARQMSCGYAEIIKMAATLDADLFCHLEAQDLPIETVIERALAIKADVVEADEREGDLRRVLNFGHTLGHGIEAASAGKLLHGECVALGMIPLSSEKVRERLVPLLQQYGLPTTYAGDSTAVLDAVRYDKKRRGENLSLVFVDRIGTYSLQTRPCDEWIKELKKAPIFAEKGEQ